MYKDGFILSVKFRDGSISEMFNCCGLKAATLDEAIHDGMIILIERHDEMIVHSSKLVGKHWVGAKAHSISYNLRNDDGSLVREETHLIDIEEGTNEEGSIFNN